ncbi:MAG: M3 family oligoendopeptidase [Bacteroidia bacterium]
MEIKEGETISGQINLESWASVEPVFNELLNRENTSVDDLRRWLQDKSEIEGILQEELGWRYIRQTCDTRNEKFRAELEFFINEIEPHLSEIGDKLNRKFLDSPFLSELPESGFAIMIRGIRKSVEMFRKDNIPLQTELQLLGNEYGRITGAMTVEVNGEEMTFQKAANLLKSNDRALRREVYEKINRRRIVDRGQLEELFDKMLVLRQKVAENAGYSNFRDYMFDALGRFDYSPEDCLDFHTSIENIVVPVCNQFDEVRKSKLGYEKLFPWDTETDPEGREPLEPFKNTAELTDKTIECFDKIRNNYGNVIELMKKEGHLDLETRVGKAPGGYNYPLYKSGLPFIFMHASGSLRDMVTMMHEGGHALHSWLSKDLELNDFKNTPSEIAEVASMAMELLSMEHWETFFSDKNTLERARRYQLEKIISILPWIATVDAFQHWIYTNPGHSPEERAAEWAKLQKRFGSKVIDKSEFPEFETHSWQRQLHIFEVPFYYIEYAIAQLGAIGIWKNYISTDPQKALDSYEESLRAGYMYGLPELYNRAGIRFDFSEEYVRGLVDMVAEKAFALD